VHGPRGLFFVLAWLVLVVIFSRRGLHLPGEEITAPGALPCDL
jgi:hypothetical protein